MPLLMENRTKMYKRKIISKYNFIRQEIENTNEILEKAKAEIDEKVGFFLKGDDDALAARFTEIDQDLEAFHNKLCFIQDTLEDGKLNIDSNISCTSNNKKKETPHTQSGTSGSSHRGGDLEQLESGSSSSSQNDKISYSKSVFLGQLASQHPSRSEKKINTEIGACAINEPNIAASLCNEPRLPNNTALASNISGLQNNITVNTVHNVIETNTERSNFSQNVKSNSVIEQVSGSDGSSVYGTVSSVCSEGQTVGKTETVTSKDLVKEFNDGANSFKEDKGACLPLKSPETNKWNGVESTLRTSDSIRHSSNVGIPYPDLRIGSSIIAAVQDITSPSDFWLQTDSPYAKEICPVTNVEHYDQLSLVKENMYCLAPFKQPGGYFRAKILELSEKIPGKQRVRVLYVDLGCKESLYASTLKVLPAPLQRLPSIAVHCALHGVVPVDGKWSYKAVEEFRKTIEVSDIKILVCSRLSDTYFVQVSITADIPENKKFTYDMGHMLCEFNFAVKDSNAAEVHQHSPPAASAQAASCSSSSNSTINLHSPISPSNDLSSMNSGEKFISAKKEFLPNSVPHDHNIMNYNFIESHQNKEADRRSVAPKEERGKSPVIGRYAVQNVQVNVKNISNHQTDAVRNHFDDTVREPNSHVNNKLQHHESRDLVSCPEVSGTDLCITDHNVKVPMHNLPDVTNDSSSTHKVPQSFSGDFDWHVNIPFPSQKFEKKEKFVVMLSAVDSPSDFYVNLATPNSADLDELQELMLSVYQNFDKSYTVLPPLPPVDKISGMFGCCQFAEDKNWYRIQVLEVCNPMEDTQNSATKVRVQYVDYGNEAEVNIKDLTPLKKEFAVHPAFSFHCSLAGIKPKLSESSCGKGAENMWSIEAVSRFKCLISFEKCYTAEIAETVVYDKWKQPLPVYLWDTVSTATTKDKDILINHILIEQGAANASDQELFDSPAEDDNIQDLDKWDPMAEDYHSMLNSYGVNTDDAEIATVGYNSTIDKTPVEYLGESMPLPSVDSTVLVLVSAMFNPGYFFVVFPFGIKSVDSIQSEIRRCVHKDDDLITEFMENLNKHYNRSIHRKENTALAPACGDLVAIKWRKDGRWYRGRVCDVLDINAPVLIYFVDFGNREVIERANVHELDPQFRHFPFQAVECHLHGTEPKSSEEGRKWSDESKNKFQEITECKVLLARIKDICGSSLYVELFVCPKDQEALSINEYLVHNGYAQPVQQVVSCSNSVLSHSSKKDGQNKNVIFIPA